MLSGASRRRWAWASAAVGLLLPAASCSPSESSAAGEGGSGVGCPVATTATVSTGTSTGGGGQDGGTTDGGAGMCDQCSMCGDATSGCIQCAEDGPCATQLGDCVLSDDCQAVAICLSACAEGSAECTQACSDQHKTGTPIYQSLFQCVICTSCPDACMTMQSGCS
jgi:hypothetical protein